MTAPIEGFETATPVQTPSYWHINVTSTDQGGQISKALADAVTAGLIANGTTLVNAQGWRLSITSPAGVDSHCTTGDYIVLGSNTTGTLVSIAFYNGPSGTYGNPVFTDSFSS